MSENFATLPLTPLRRAIAARMTEAKRDIPHFGMVVDMEMDALLARYAVIKEHHRDAKVSLNALLIKSCAMALMDVPAVNIQWADDAVRQYQDADISVVVALAGGGLTTPIIRSAQTKSILEISREVRELSARASNNTVKAREVLGGSFSVSNLGMYGVYQFDAIINAPQCAILAIGAAGPRVLASPEGRTRVATVMRTTLSVDHRAIDGATAALFLAALRRRIEQPAEFIPDEGA